MAARSRISRLVLAVSCAAFGVAAPVTLAAPAAACPVGMYADPYSGQCFTQGAMPTVNGHPCIPGQSLGTCLGFLQNMPVPGGGPPGGPWP
jgi:hypothetical protein